jgi:hypothetical protein
MLSTTRSRREPWDVNGKVVNMDLILEQEQSYAWLPTVAQECSSSRDTPVMLASVPL